MQTPWDCIKQGARLSLFARDLKQNSTSNSSPRSAQKLVGGSFCNHRGEQDQNLKEVMLLSILEFDCKLGILILIFKGILL